jgi:hypothetical protein
MRNVLVSLLAILSLGWPLQANAGETPVVFWRLKSLGIEEATVEGVSKVLASEIGRIEGIGLVPADQVRAAVSSHEGLARCAGEPACLAQVGKAAGASSVVSGVLGILGDVYSLDIKLVDVASGMEVRRVAQTWSGQSDSLIEAMRQVATRLLRPESYKGTLDLKVNLDKVRIYVDGEMVGLTPLAAPLRLTPGRHALKLVAPGFGDFEKFIDLPFDRTVPVNVEMKGLALSGVVSADQAEDFFQIGIKAGLVSNTGPFLAPHASLEFGVRLPFWGGRLAVLAESGAYGSVDERTASSGSTGEVKVGATMLIWPVQLNLILRALPDYPFSPYLTAGPGFFVVWQTLEPEGLPRQSYRDSVFGFQAGAGLEYRMGPGVVMLEARYLHVWVEGPRSEGGLDGLLGGLGALLGYRILL